MTARTHDAIAFASLLTVAALHPPASISILTVGVSVVANIVGALLPDIDEASNRLWDLLPGGDGTGKVLRNFFLHHRTITHSLLGLFLISKFFSWVLPKIFNPVYVNPQIVFYSIMIGYISHLLADTITKEGVPYLFPLPWKFGIPPLQALRVRTGSWVEFWLVLPGVGIYLLWFIWKFQIEILNLVKNIVR
jgi:inner membrane protein